MLESPEALKARVETKQGEPPALLSAVDKTSCITPGKHLSRQGAWNGVQQGSGGPCLRFRRQPDPLHRRVGGARRLPRYPLGPGFARSQRALQAIIPWVVLGVVDSLLAMAVLPVVFLGLFGFGIEHCPIYILAGVLLWDLFALGTSEVRRVFDAGGDSWSSSRHWRGARTAEAGPHGVRDAFIRRSSA